MINTLPEDKLKTKKEKINKNTQQHVKIVEEQKYKENNKLLSNKIKVLISKKDDPKIVAQFFNVISGFTVFSY